MRALLVEWHGGGNAPPVLAAGSLLGEAGFSVTALVSDAVVPAAQAAAFAVVRFERAPPPVTAVPFEAVTAKMLAVAAGSEIAADTRAALEQLRPEIALVDCMLPAALAACAAAQVACVSIVHFAYGCARDRMRAGGGAWTTDRPALEATRRALGLSPLDSDLACWESPEMLLVTAPRWFDVPTEFAANTVHAGPLGVRRGCSPRRRGRQVLVAFSTTPMAEQNEVVQRVCDAVDQIGVPCLLTLGPAIAEADLQLGETTAPVSSIDHDLVMPDTDVVVTHGGLGTVLRALAHGVPLVVLPLGRDQRINAERVADLGAGVQLDRRADHRAIARAIETVLHDRRFSAAARELAERIDREQPDRAALAAMLQVRDRRTASSVRRRTPIT